MTKKKRTWSEGNMCWCACATSCISIKMMCSICFLFHISFTVFLIFSFCPLKFTRWFDVRNGECQTNSIRYNFAFKCNKMIYLQSLILEQIYVCSYKKSTDENWIRHGSISFSQFRTCASLCMWLCSKYARIAMEMIRIHVYAYEWTNILVYILWLDLQWIFWKSAIKSVVA